MKKEKCFNAKANFSFFLNYSVSLRSLFTTLRQLVEKRYLFHSNYRSEWFFVLEM